MPTPVNDGLDWSKQKVVKVDGHWHIEGHPINQVSVNWHETPSNMPDKAYIGLRVISPVNASSPPHYHGGAAVAATVIRGRVLNQMVCADGHVIGPNVYEAGESWYEGPGCHHVRCANAGTEEAEFIAAFVIDAAAVREKGLVAATIQYDADLAQGSPS